VGYVRRLARDERVGFEPTDPLGLEAHWRQFSPRRTASTKLWMDAYLAAFAVASGLRLVTTDAAFRQFAGLDVLVLGAAAA
jgi:predicted nucleic acid-binding protein